MDPAPLPPADEAWETQPSRIGRADLKMGPRARRLRRLWRIFPSPPRCKMCNSPFGPPGGAILRLVGKGRWPGNPKYCAGCFRSIYRNRAGAEIVCTLLFADIRGSTELGESMPASAFRALLDRFYAAAVAVLVEHEAIVDKFVGDEVIGIFVPALAGEDHARRGIDAGLALLRATGTPIGIGLNTGVAYVGAVGTAEHIEFTALGDNVNITARLASAARPGEMLVTDAAARAAGISLTGLEHRRVDLRGRAAPTDVYVLERYVP